MLLNDGELEPLCTRLEKDIEVIFRTTLGDITPMSNGKTDSSGVAKAILNSNKCGTAIVTATSKDCIPGITNVHFRLCCNEV